MLTHPGKDILSTYLRRLTNLSGTNRSLVLLRLYADQLADLHEANHLNKLPSFEIIKALIAGKDVKLCPVLDSRLEASNAFSHKLKKLQRTDQFIFEERGSNDLHVGWPFVRGKFSDGTLVRCPLLFFPVSLGQYNQSWYLHVRHQAGVTLNKSFLLAYSFYNKVKPDEELLDFSFEDFNVDSTVFRTELYQLLKEKLEVNFNPDNFRDELIPFESFKRDAFEKIHRNGELKLFPEAVLGIFPQAGSQLVPDYLHLMEKGITDLEPFFLDKKVPDDPASSLSGTNTGFSFPVKEEKLFTPFLLDAYQENAIRAIKNGRSVVVQGPPGTGKSQLICNLMADAIATGRKVLLVCQKRAALDVVYQRMQSKELGDFAGLVHDFRNERKNIFTRIARQIDNIENFRAQNRSIDIIQTERRFLQVCRTIDQITEELDGFKHVLFDDSECGLSVKALYLTSDPQSPTINIRQEYQFFPFTQLPSFLETFRRYCDYASVFEKQEYPWRERKSFASYTAPDQRKIEETVEDIPACQKQLQDQLRDLIGVTLNLEECESLRTREDDILGMIAMMKNEDIFRYAQAMIDESDDETSLLWFTNVERVLMNCFEGLGPETSLPSDKLGKFQETLHHRMQARRNLFKLIRWELFSKDKTWLRRVLIANGLGYTKKGLLSLEQKIDNRLNLEHHLTAIKKKNWLIDLPQEYYQSDLKTWFNNQKLAIRAKLIFRSLREVKNAVHLRAFSREDFAVLFKSILQVISIIPSRRESWLQYLSPYQVRQLVHEPGLEKEYRSTLRNDFDSLCEFDRIRENLRPYEKDVISRLHDTLQHWDFLPLEKLLQNSLRLAWIDHIEAKHPELRAVSSKKMEQQREELQQKVEEKQKLSQDILLLRARERLYENVEYNRLNNRITYRDLYHQVTKKKKLWPLRKVIREFKHEIFNVIPCWMASPESVSAIFPMEEFFDLVIFDEASQCFSERGIPAMFRGKLLLIAGDDQQLKPNELYQVRWEEEDEHPDLEVDSLLDLAERYLPTVHLQGHYRSRSLELIEFSNRHFYGGRLKLLPDRHAINTGLPAIEYHNVKGTWLDNTNRVEAEDVVARVLSLMVSDPEKEIGIVTFNAPQQYLILDLLEEALAQQGKPVPPSLLIRNIENVQGDEKDIIIFSVGYAKGANQKVNMQFGSLSMAGGENRLNVAVTRAREKIILVCSIEPEDLRTDDLKNDGPRLLKAYLEFARSVHQGKYKPEVQHEHSHPAGWYLNRLIRDWGANTFRQLTFEADGLPMADLHFRSGDQYLGMILTDDLYYYSSLSSKHSFAYVPSLINRKSWDFQYVFSRNYWQNREKMQEDLLRFIGSKIPSTDN